MQLEIKRNNTKVVPTGQFTSTPSRWSALHNPLFYEVLRKDYDISILSQSGSGYKCTLASSVTNGDSINVGDFIHISSSGIDEVVEVLTTNGTTEFYFENIEAKNYTGGFGGWINLNTIRQNFRVEARVFSDVEDLSISIYRPSPLGVIMVVVNENVFPSAKYEIGFDYETANPNYKDTGISNNVNVELTAKWYVLDQNGMRIEKDFFLASDDLWKQYWVNNARQVNDRYGQNMAVNVPEPAGLVKAKILGAFERPTFFRCYPFSFSFIFSEKIAAQPIVWMKTTTQNFTKQLQNNQSGYVNHIALWCGMSGLFPNTKFIENRILIDDGLTPLLADYVAPGYVAAGYFERR